MDFLKVPCALLGDTHCESLVSLPNHVCNCYWIVRGTFSQNYIGLFVLRSFLLIACAQSLHTLFTCHLHHYLAQSW